MVALLICINMIRRFFVFVIVLLFLCASCQLLNVPAQPQSTEAAKTENNEVKKTQKETNAGTAENSDVKKVEKTKK